jgi:hypothetical protein
MGEAGQRREPRMRDVGMADAVAEPVGVDLPERKQSDLGILPGTESALDNQQHLVI